MDRVAVRRDRRVTNRAVVIRQIVRLDDRRRTALYRFVERVIGIFDLKRDVADAVAVLLDVLGCRMLRRKRRRQDKIDAILPQQITRRLAIAGLKPRIRRTRKPERLAVIKLRLLCVADVKLNVMYLL